MFENFRFVNLNFFLVLRRKKFEDFGNWLEVYISDVAKLKRTKSQIKLVCQEQKTARGLKFISLLYQYSTITNI